MADLQRDLVARVLCHHAIIQGRGIVHRLAVHRQDHVASMNAGSVSGAAGIDVADQHALRPVEPHAGGDLAGDLLTAHAQPGAHHVVATAKRRVHHLLDHGRGDGEADSRGGACARQD